MQPINFVFQTGRIEGPFTIQFDHIPTSFVEIRTYARYVMNCVREANSEIGYGFDEKTLELMGREFEGFLAQLWASDVVVKRANEIVSRAERQVRRRLDRIIRAASDV